MLELFDLDELVDTFPTDPRIAALKPLIRAAISMSSVRNDLKRAGEMMAACKTLSNSIRTAADRGQATGREQAATVQALFAQAVMLYTRATHSRAEGRNKLQITAHLSAKERPLHDRITQLRDRYLAHFGDAAGWEEHRAVLALDIEEARMALSYPHASAYILAAEAIDFERLLEIVLPVAQRQSDAVSRKLNLALNELFDASPDFVERLREVRFDPAHFFCADEIQPYLDSVGKHDPDPLTQPRIGGIRWATAERSNSRDVEE